MPNQEQTEKIYIENGIQSTFEVPMDLTKVRTWRRQVTSEGGNFNQDPDNPDVKYPWKVPTQIIRNKLLSKKGKEYLTTIETWSGVDGNRNVKSIDVSQMQCYDKPNIEIISVPSIADPTVSDKQKKVVGSTREYTEEFNKKTAEEAYDRSDKYTVTLMVKEVGRGRNEVGVKDFNLFVSRDFDDLLNKKPVEEPKKEEEKEKPKHVDIHQSTTKKFSTPRKEVKEDNIIQRTYDSISQR